MLSVAQSGAAAVSKMIRVKPVIRHFDTTCNCIFRFFIVLGLHLLVYFSFHY